MRKFRFIVLSLALTACSDQKKEVPVKGNRGFEENAGNNVTVAEKTKNALEFLNVYIAQVHNLKSSSTNDNFIENSTLLTKKFKSERKRILAEAWERDPEMGLGFDEILDAQDYPDKGFEFVSFDEKTNVLLVKGIDWPEFKLTARVAEENGEWLLDGCGIVNVAEELRSER